MCITARCLLWLVGSPCTVPDKGVIDACVMLTYLFLCRAPAHALRRQPRLERRVSSFQLRRAPTQLLPLACLSCGPEKRTDLKAVERQLG